MNSALDHSVDYTAKQAQDGLCAAQTHSTVAAPTLEADSTRNTDRRILRKRLSDLEVERIILEQAILDRIKDIKSSQVVLAT